MKKILITLICLFPLVSIAQFSPSISVSLSNLDCDTLSGINISLSQNSGEVDIANAVFESNSGYFDIPNVSLNDTIGSASLTAGGGSLSFSSVLVVDSLTFSEIHVESIDINTGLSLGNFTLINTSNGILINATSPSDGNNYTSGNSSTISFNDIFQNPLAPSISFATIVISELGDIDNQTFNIDLLGICAFCNTYADFGIDTINACDSASVQISSPPVENGSFVYQTSDNTTYAGIWHDSITPGQNVQDMLNDGINPLDIYNAGYSLSSIYGKNFNGGIIFYLDLTTGDGLLANDFDLTQTDWGCNSTLLGGTQLGIGTGQSNTDTILSLCSQAGIAAKLCDDFSNNGYYDWYLPSFSELTQMFNNLQVNGHSSFNNYYYWSSSEWDNDEAYMFHFTLGYGGFALKSNNYDIRPIRSFSYQPYNNLTNLNITTSGWNYITVTDSLGCTASDSVFVLLESSTYGNDTQVACDSFTWINGVTYTSSTNTETHILTNSVGCDSVVSLDLTVNYSTSSTETTTVCDSYFWNGTNYNTTGLYSVLFTNTVGCDSIAYLDLTVNYSNSSLETTTVCDSYLWNGLLYTVSGVYDTVFTNIDGCDSTATLDLTVNYSNSSLETTVACDSYLWNGVTYTTSGSYSALFTNVDGCDSTANLDLTINYSDGDTTTVVACDSYTWEGTTYTTSGLWNTILINQYGCDSVAYIDLTVNYSSSGNVSVTTCDSYVWEGVTYVLSGVYTNILTNSVGCDSVATLSLTINYSDTIPSQFNDFYICDGESVTVGTQTYTLPGTYIDTLADFNGCDSIVSTNLTVSYLNISLSSTPVTCSTFNDGSAQVIANSGQGNISYLWNTGSNNTSIDSLVMGTYTITVSDSLCVLNDSISVDLNVAPADSMHPEICYATVDFTGFNRIVLKPLVNPLTTNYILFKEYSAGLYSPLDTLPSTVLSYIDSNSNPSVQAERYKVAAIDVCGNVSDTSDYHKTVHLSMNTGINGEVNLSWNNYEGYQVSNYLIYRQDSTGANVLLTSISGTNTSYTDLVPPLGPLNYKVRALAQQCTPIENSIVKNQGLVQMTNDTLESNIVNHTNISLQVTVIPTNPSCLTCTDGTIIANASGGTSPYTYSWSNGISGFFNGNLGVGTYTVYVFDSMGDSTSATVTLFFDVYGCMDSNAINYDPLANIDDSSCVYCVDNGVGINVISCDTYLWNLNNINYDSSGTYLNVSLDSLGCTITDTLHLTINYSSSSTVTISACDSFDWDGVTYDSTGIYTNVYTDVNGCDSTVTLDLTINNSSSSTVTISACDSFDWDGMTYDSTGLYTNVYTDVNGCDSTVTLDLTINNSSSSTVTITACDSFDWDGVTYDSTGLYTNVYTDVNGCDSTVTLDLTILGNSSSSTVTITACDSFDWDGVTYDSTGTYTNVYTDVNGCDSTVTLDLTINNSSTSTVTITACDSFDWDGVTYDSTGTYTNVYTDVNGCDSTVTLDLTIYEGPTDATVTQSGDTLTVTVTTGTAPYTYLWNTGETSQSILPDSSGTYWCIVTDANGCEDYSNQYVYTSTSVENVVINNLSIYPNPTRGLLNIEFNNVDSKVNSITVVNVLGDRIFNENIDSNTLKYSNNLDLSKYSNGIYFVRFKMSEGFITKKLILQ